MAKNSQEFEEKKKILEIERDNINLRHENTMKELVYKRENATIFHDQELTRHRIKNADIKRSQERKEFSEMRKQKHGRH